MRIVAIGAGHFTETQWVTARSQGLSTGALMACKTFFLLRQLIQCRILRGMHFMAACTGHFFFLVDAARPMCPGFTGVTGKTDFILLDHRGFAIECHVRQKAITIFRLFAMGIAWTVTSLAVMATIGKG